MVVPGVRSKEKRLKLEMGEDNYAAVVALSECRDDEALHLGRRSSSSTVYDYRLASELTCPSAEWLRSLGSARMRSEEENPMRIVLAGRRYFAGVYQIGDV
jgi:hypothetical protein